MLPLPFPNPATKGFVQPLHATAQPYPTKLYSRSTLRLNPTPFPSIIPVQAGKEPLFALIQKATQEGVQLQYSPQETKTHTWQELSQIWGGHLLLLEPQEQSGEQGYAENRRRERWEKARWAIIALLATILVGGALMQARSWSSVLGILIKLSGVALSILLIQTEGGQAPSWVQQICNGGGEKSGCQSVVSSKASESEFLLYSKAKTHKIFKFIIYSPRSSIYYSGTFIIL